MTHGTEHFFLERRRVARRTSALAAGVALALLGVLQLARLHPVQQEIVRVTRFGLEGQVRYVERIRLVESSGAGEQPRVTLLPGANVRRGGETRKASPRGTAPRTAERRDVQEGDALADLAGRAPSLRADVPFVTKDDLVIEVRVEPIFPEEAKERDVEGQVTLLAVIDSTGRVRDVDVMSSPDRLLSDAATTAVKQWRFRPYRIGGVPSEVQVLFPFRFTLVRN